MEEVKAFWKNKLEEIKSLVCKYCVVSGYAEIRYDSEGVLRFKHPSWENMTILFGLADDNLVLQAFEEYECSLPKSGDYLFWVMLSHSPAQVGNYPPPNVEVPEYWMIEYAEFESATEPED